MALPWWQHHKHCLGYYYYFLLYYYYYYYYGSVLFHSPRIVRYWQKIAKFIYPPVLNALWVVSTQCRSVKDGRQTEVLYQYSAPVLMCWRDIIKWVCKNILQIILIVETSAKTREQRFGAPCIGRLPSVSFASDVYTRKLSQRCRRSCGMIALQSWKHFCINSRLRFVSGGYNNASRTLTFVKVTSSTS